MLLRRDELDRLERLDGRLVLSSALTGLWIGPAVVGALSWLLNGSEIGLWLFACFGGVLLASSLYRRRLLAQRKRVLEVARQRQPDVAGPIAIGTRKRSAP